MTNQVSGGDIVAGMIGRTFEEGAIASPRKSKQFQYWKKCAGCQIHQLENLWVFLGPVMTPYTAIEYTEFQQSKHATPLPQYGSYYLGLAAGQKYNLTKPGERFRPIIELGGIDEFPTEQMIAYNWHRFPVMVKVRPDLTNVVDISCEHGCSGRLFTSKKDYQDHVSVMHKDVAQPEAIGRQFREAIQSMAGNSRQLDNETLTQIAVAIAQALKADAKETARTING